MRQMSIAQRAWPTQGTFRISRSALQMIITLQVTVRQDGFAGRGECRPYPRYKQSVASVTRRLKAVQARVEAGESGAAILADIPPGPARNALSCALVDLRAKITGTPAWAVLGVAEPGPRRTAFTLSVDTPQRMAAAAAAAEAHTLLKVKLGASDVLPCLRAVTLARPNAELIVDANEAFTPDTLADLWPELSALPIVMMEQPLPADHLEPLPAGGPVVCADEGLHTADDLPRLKALGYRAVNVKLDKCGGVEAARDLMQRARALDMQVMAGCMVASSLGMAPMMVLESLADVIDLDGPLLLAKDEVPGLRYEGERVFPPEPALWG